jgi:hypothetical protein
MAIGAAAPPASRRHRRLSGSMENATTRERLSARLLGLLALDAAACVAVAAGAGKLPSADAVGLAAAAAGVLAVAAFGAYTGLGEGAGTAAASRSRERTKTFLALMLLVGAAAYFGGKGTYSSFSAETTNPGSTAASGTLTFSDQVDTNSACLSVNGATQNNVNATCGAILSLTNLAPGLYGGAAQVTLKNTGSIDASKLYFWASQVNTTLSSGLTAGTPTTTLPVNPLEGTITSGDSIVVSYGFHTQTFTANGVTAAGSTSITVTSATPNYSYPANSTVTDTSSNTGVTTTLSSGLTSGNSVSSLSVSALPKAVNSGDFVTVASGSNRQTFTASANAAAGATSIAVSTTTASFSFPIGSTVSDPNNIDCYDQRTTTAGSPGATKGSDLNFNSPTGNPLCGTLLVYVQETTGGNHYCWFGNAVSSAMCAAPVSVNPSSSVTGSAGLSSIPVGGSGLNGNIKNGDTLTLTSTTGNTTSTLQCTAQANYYFGYTGNIGVSGCTGSYVTYPTSSLLTDSSMLSTLNSDSTHTIQNFDTGHSYSGQVQLYPLTGDGAANTSAAVELGKAGSSSPPDTRTFQIGVYLPAPGGVNQNSLQGLFSTFGITWHIDQ